MRSFRCSNSSACSEAYPDRRYPGIFLDHPGHFREVVDKFRDIPEIIECHYTTGNYSLFIKVYTRDNEHLRMILTDTIQNISGIVRTETLISLEESINRQIPVLSRSSE